MSGMPPAIRMSRVLLATCMALVLPAALAVPYYDGNGADADRVAWPTAHGGWLVAAYAQAATDADLYVDPYNNAIFVAPNQLNITWTKNASASTESYKVAMDFYNFDGDYDLRNVTAIAGNGTMVHTLTFNGPPVGKDAGNDGAAYIMIGSVTNRTGTLWVDWESTWADPPSNYYANSDVADAQRPEVVSARLTSGTALAVSYDEPVTYVQAADYRLMLNDNSTVAVESVFNADGDPLVRFQYSVTHVLVLNRSLALDEIMHLAIANANNTDASSYLVNNTSVTGNQLVDDTVTVTDGQPPTPIRAEIVGPLQINVTFSEPVYTSPSNYAGLAIYANYVAFEDENRTVTAVEGNGTAVHTLTLDKKPIPLPSTGPTATGRIDIASVSDLAGNSMANPKYLAISDARTRDGVPWMYAARFTGPSEITVSYNASATVPEGGYSAFVNARSMPDAPESDTFSYTWGSYNVSYANRTSATGERLFAAGSYNGTFVKLNITSVEGNGTPLHRLMVADDGIQKTATGLINVTGLAQGDGTPVARNYTDVIVYDEQLPRVTSARITGNNTVVVEYDQRTFGPLSGYPAVSVRMDGSAAWEDRAVTRVFSGTMEVLKPFGETSRLFTSSGYGEPIPSIYPSYPEFFLANYTASIEVATPPAVLNPYVLTNRFTNTSTADPNNIAAVGYAGDLLLSNGKTVWIGVIGPSETGTWLVQSDAVLSLNGVEYLNIHSDETAAGCRFMSVPGGGGVAEFVASRDDCSRSGMPGTHHMLTVAGPSNDTAVNATLSELRYALDGARVTISSKVTGSSGSYTSNGDPIDRIGVWYYQLLGEDYYDQQVPNNRTATFDLLQDQQTFVDFFLDRPAGAFVPISNPSLHVGPDDAVLQMTFVEPVVPSSIDASAGIKISLISSAITSDSANINASSLPVGLTIDLREYYRSPATAIDSTRIAIKLPSVNITVKNPNYFAYPADDNTTRTLPPMIRTTLHEYLATVRGANVEFTEGFATFESGGMAGGSRQYVPVDDSPVPALVKSAAMTGPNTLAVRYTDPVNVTYADLVLDPGGPRTVTNVDGNAGKRHTVTFDGLKVRSHATAVASIVSGAIWAEYTNSTGHTVCCESTGARTGYAVNLPAQKIAPLSGDAPAPDLAAAVQIRQAGITSGNAVTITYTGAVNASAADYTGLVLAQGGARNITGVEGSGTERHVVSFSGTAASMGTNATINISPLSAPDGFFAFGGAVNQTITDARSAGTAWLLSLESNQGQLVARYTNPLNASVADYTIMLSDGRTPVEITNMTGAGTSNHTLVHEILPNGTWIQVSISYLPDRGSGYEYAGTLQQPRTVETRSQSRTIATLTDLASNGMQLQASYSARVNASVSDYILRDENGMVEVTSIANNNTALHTITHGAVPNGAQLEVTILALEGPDAIFLGVANRTITVDTGAALARPAQADASFTARNTVEIRYNAPLDAPSDYTGDVYGPITVAGEQMQVMTTTGLGTTTHTVVFDGSVTASQTGRIMVNTVLSGMADGALYRFTEAAIDIAAGGDGAIMPVVDMPVVAIEPDGFVRTVNIVDRGDTARPAINVTALSADPLVADAAGNTVTFPDEETMIQASFAHVTFPPNTNASSVPADGLLELYVSTERPTAAGVARALGNPDASAVTIGRVVEIGDDQTHITFDTPIRILIAGSSANSSAFYVNNTNNNVVAITTVCTDDSTAAVAAQLGGAGECSLGSDDGKIIHTYHLTRFGTANNGTGTGGVPPDSTGNATASVEHVVSNGYSVAVFYSDPVSASPVDYNITRMDGGQVNATSVRGSGSAVHLVAYDPRLADGTMINVSIAALRDAGTGYEYAGTSVPYKITVNSSAAAPANASVAIARAASISSSGTTTMMITYTGPVNATAADYTMWELDGTAINVTGLAGSGTAMHTITHTNATDGERVRLGAMPLADAGSGSVYLGGTYGINVGSTVDDPPLLVIADMDRTNGVRLIRAEITGPNTISVTYSGQGIAGMLSDYADLELFPGGNRTMTSLSGSGTTIHTLTFDGPKARSNATGTMSIATMDYPPEYFAGVSNHTVRDGQDAPYVYSVTTNATDSSYTVGSTIYIEVEFSELVVYGTDETAQASGGVTESIALVGGGDDRLFLALNTNRTIGLALTYASATYSYVFAYIVQEGDDSDGYLDYLNASALGKKAGVALRDSLNFLGDSGNQDANLTLPAGGSPDSLAAAMLYVYDAPRVAALSAPAGQYNAGDQLRLTANLSRSVTVYGAAPSLELGSPAARAAYGSGNGTDAYVFTYTVRQADTLEGLLRSVAIVVPGSAGLTTSAGTAFGADLGRIEGVSGLALPGVTVGTGVVPPVIPPTTVIPTAPTVVPTVPFGGGGGGGGGRGGSSGGGSIGLNVGGPGDAITIYSASWDCNVETIRIAVDDGASSATVSVLSSAGTTAAAKSKVQDLEGRIVYEAFLPDDDILSIRAVSVEGRIVMTASEIVRTGGACTGEAVFNQYREAVQPRMDQEEVVPDAKPDTTEPKPRVVQPPIDDAPLDDTDDADMPMPPPQERPAFEMEAGRDASYYVKRYAEQADYRTWFDGSYPQYDSICEAVGVAPGCVEAYLEAQAVDDDAPPPVPECDEGMVMRNGECVEAEMPEPTPQPAVAADDDDNGCLIATAAYGTELAPQVQALREVRDATLLSTGAGSGFMSSFSSVYYAFSPHVADLEREVPAFRQAVGLFLTPMVYALQVVTLAEPGSESDVLAYGIVAIALVAGMYVAAPVAGAWYAGRLFAAVAHSRRRASRL